MVDRTPDSLVGTATYRLADTLLNGELRTFVATRRASGVAWRRIANELRDVTDRQVDVSSETLRQWAKQLGIGAAA